MLEEINKSLESALLKRADLLLILLQIMSISILEDNWAIEKYVVKLAELEKYLFATSLMGATIQNGGKRERSDT